jgi:hypothetical protein
VDEQRVMVRDGRVYRPAQWWTPTVHALLNHLRAVGFTQAPRPLGVVDGQEILQFIPGDSGPAGWSRVVPEKGLRAMARLLRDYHQATAGFVAPPDARWALADGPAAPGQVICHGDFAPWNVVWDDLTPVGLVDFDMAQPGEVLDDVAYALEYVTPFRDDAQAMRWQGFAAPPDRPRRIEVFAEEYGLSDVDGLVDAVIRRQERTIHAMEELLGRGLRRYRSWLAEGVFDMHAARVRWSRQNRALFTADTEPDKSG